MIYLNRALDVYNTAVVTPLLYVVFTGCVIVASAVLFREWGSLSEEDIVGNLCGFFVIIAGIFLLQTFRDLDISMKNLPRAKKDDARKLEGLSTYSSSSSMEQTSHNVDSALLRSNSGTHSFDGSENYYNRPNSYSQ